MAERIKAAWRVMPLVTKVTFYTICALWLLSVFFDAMITYGCSQPSLVFLSGQLWRLVTPPFLHLTIWHLLFNALTLLFTGYRLERRIGSARMLHMMSMTIILISVLNVGISFILASNPLYSINTFFYECAVGYSGVLFAFVVVDIRDAGIQTIPFCFLFNIPGWLYPFILLLFVQLMMMQVSLISHCLGILVGYMWSWFLRGIMIDKKAKAYEKFVFPDIALKHPGFVPLSEAISDGCNKPDRTIKPTNVQNGSLSARHSSGIDLRRGTVDHSIESQRPVPPKGKKDKKEKKKFTGKGRTMN
ncbi:hypothetical protein KIPB_001565 [Kipferlia bialata]|uniref:Peptidase S54 rhomboid domain-containing protein n=1 Tax=Kipferlia bialata TaxID=797122 RepID=A0A9K3GG14_9EUKA|nr:hypothetical protein KIPB_001565 [Kipferlia bialata]|eukprot:g1565.t1